MKTWKQLFRTMLFACAAVFLLAAQATAVNVTDVSFGFEDSAEAFGYFKDYNIPLSAYGHVPKSQESSEEY